MSNRYKKIVEWSEDDECYIGKCPAIIGNCCHGDDEVEVYKELCLIVDEWIEINNQDSSVMPELDVKKYSGKFNLRIKPDLHFHLATIASQENKSLNTYCAELLSNSAN